MNIIHNQYRRYSGKLGKEITTLDELAELAERKGAVAVKSGNNSFSVLPAKSLLYRTAFNVYQMLKPGELHEYIKPERIQKAPQKWSKSRKETKQDKINRALEFCLNHIQYDENGDMTSLSACASGVIYQLDKDIWRCLLNLDKKSLDDFARKQEGLAKARALFEKKKLGDMKYPIVKKEKK